MGKCDRCHKREGVHRWGSWWLCDECHELYLKDRQSKDEDPTINIPEETGHPLSGGWYRQGEGKIYLVKSPLNIEMVINHEVIHHVLNILIDPPTSYDFDNIEDHVDSYHGLS